MKKIFLLAIAIFMVSNIANACSGITIKGQSGKSYCLSKSPMNWYSAYTWCQAQGKHLINLDTVCGKSTGYCTELTLSSDEKNNIQENGGVAGMAWTDNSVASNIAFWVSVMNGQIATRLRDDANYYALCN